jgi:hypothetical protein
MAAAVYILGTLVSLTCAVMLLLGFFRARQRLLLWSGLCFFGLAVSNLLVFLDLVIYPDLDLYRWRLVTAALAMMLLMFGLIWEGE